VNWAGVAVAALPVAIVCVLWAGLLVLARGSRNVAASLGDVPSAPGDGVPADRALHVARLTLLVLAGASLAQVVEWWDHPWLAGLGRVALAVGLSYVVADAIPRALAVLAPRAAERAAPLALASLAPFRPLLGLIGAIEHRMHAVLPAPTVRHERFSREHRDMLQGVFTLGETTVAQVMTPRLDIVALDVDAEWRDVVEFLSRSDHARTPVFRSDLDDVIGILYAKDLTPAVSGVAEVPERWQDVLRPPTFVPESKSLTQQLRDFQRGPSGVVIVVDEFGGTSGLVTLEDVLEEVVGDIYGEYDAHDQPPVEQEGDDKFWVKGSFSLADLSSLVGVEIVGEEVSTVGGLVYAELGHVPSPGEELRIDGFRVVVEQVHRRRITRVYFERSSREPAAESGTERAT
jgi:CBS domain containing-hemolysin-like protein